MSVFPERIEQPKIFKSAEIAYILRDRYLQQQYEKFKKEEPKEVSKLWEDHFKSVAEFNYYLFMNGGYYKSAMEKIRSVCQLSTIRGLRSRRGVKV